MMGRQSKDAPGAVGQPLFATTHWSVVLAEGNKETPETAVALEQLCRTYLYPLYAYVRRRGHEDAQERSFGVVRPARFSPGGRFLMTNAKPILGAKCPCKRASWQTYSVRRFLPTVGYLRSVTPTE